MSRSGMANAAFEAAAIGRRYKVRREEKKALKAREGAECEHYSEDSSFKPNKCGSKAGLLNKIVYHLIPNLIFGGSCSCHDLDYFFGGVKRFDDTFRYKADKSFLVDMLARVEKLYFLRRPLYRKLAKVYYNAVRKAGEGSFCWFDTVAEWKSHLDANGYDSDFLDEAFSLELRRTF